MRPLGEERTWCPKANEGDNLFDRVGLGRNASVSSRFWHLSHTYRLFFAITGPMKNSLRYLLQILSFLILIPHATWASNSQSLTLKTVPLVLVTEIDDALKVTDSLDLEQSMNNKQRTENVFRGMPEIFQIIKGNYARMPVIYLSNTLASQMQVLHTKFVSDNGFPEGMMLLRQNQNDTEYKINRLREIVKSTQPRVMILFGTNASVDPLVYDQIKKEFPQIVMLNYMHQIYSTKSTKYVGQPLLSGQMGYVTPIEVAIDLAAKRLITIQQAQSLIDLLVPKIIQVASMEDEQGVKGELSFPRWQDCRDFRWPPGIDAMFPDIQRDSLLNTLKSRIISRCAKPGFGG